MLKQYLEEVDDLEVRYQLAMAVSMYDVALDSLKALKDGERVRGFINYLPPNKHHEFRKKIDQLLANSVSARSARLHIPAAGSHPIVP